MNVLAVLVGVLCILPWVAIGLMCMIGPIFFGDGREVRA